MPDSTQSGGVALRCLIAGVLVGFHLMSFHGGVTAQAGNPLLDLAAAALTPNDIEESGWLHSGAFYESIEGDAAGVADYRGQGTTADAVLETLKQLGWQRAYFSSMVLPVTLNPSVSVGKIRLYIREFGDSEGAAAGFSFLEDESGIVSASDVAGNVVIGNHSELTRSRGVSVIDGRNYKSLDLTFQHERFVAGVMIINFPGQQFEDPLVEQAEQLAMILLNRIENLPAAGTTVGSAVLRIVSTSAALPIYDDAYYLLDGLPLELEREAKASAAARLASYGDATSVYQLWMGIHDGKAAWLYAASVFQFPSEASAIEWLATLQEHLATSASYGDLKPVTDFPAVGAQSMALTYQNQGKPGAASMLVAIREGAFVARLHLVPGNPASQVTVDALVELATQQDACLKVLTCASAAGVPESLTGSE